MLSLICNYSVIALIIKGCFGCSVTANGCSVSAGLTLCFDHVDSENYVGFKLERVCDRNHDAD